MPRIFVNNLWLEYQICAADKPATLLLIQGLSMQLTDWPPGLTEQLSQDYRLVIFDNRDIGLSDKIAESDTYEKDTGFFSQNPRHSSYNLFDMAEDARQLMQALAIDEYHVLGFSMGGMIAQILAAQHPRQVLSLTSVFSSGGQAEIQPITAARFAMEQSARHVSVKTAIRQLAAACEIYAGSQFPCSQAEARQWATQSINRSHCPEGIYRQGLAMRNSGDRQALLQTIQAPALVIHGTDDPCIPLEQGIQAARLIPNSRLWVIEGLGHDFPDAIIPPLAEAILQHCENCQIPAAES